MKGIIDRFEGNFAVIELEDKSLLNIEIQKLPPKSKEGDMFFIHNHIIQFDESGTIERKKRIQKLSKNLWVNEKNPS